MQRLNYPKAPIIEAVIDLRVTPVEGFEVAQFDALRERLQSEYPQRKLIGTVDVEIGPEHGLKVEDNEQRRGIGLRSADGVRSIQARLDGFTFSQSGPYNAWEPFRDEARRLWDIYRSLYATSEITRVAHRVINQLNMPSEPALELRKYLHTAPIMAPKFPDGEVHGFFMQLQLWLSDLECSVVVNEASVPPPNEETISVMLDFDLFREQFEKPWSIEQDEEMWNFLDRLHVRRNEMFEASLTDQMKELLR